MEGSSLDHNGDDEESIDEDRGLERKFCGRLSCSCCWKVTFFLVTFFLVTLASTVALALLFFRLQFEVSVDIAAIVSSVITTFNRILHPELFEDGNPCTTFFPLVGLILVAAPVGVAVIMVVITIWASLPVQKKAMQDVRRDHRLKEVEKEKEKAEKMLTQYNEKTQDEVSSYQKEQHSDDDQEADLDEDTEEIFYHKPVPILELGSRLQKYWSLDDSETEIRSMAKKSLLCHLTKEGFDEVNQFLKTLKHDHIQIIFSVQLKESDGDSQVIITQPLWRRGSLRDLIHRVSDPMADWEEKYRADSGRPLAIERVSLYGKQILQAMLFLYKQKFSNKQLCPLGQVQSGNIFIVDDDTCVLGGYENVLLNYRTSLYSAIAHYGLLEYIDIIMFGHVVYEMSTGKSLKNIVPNEEEYEMVMDEMCLEILKYIFKRNGRGHLCYGIKKISKQNFFVKLAKPKTGEKVTPSQATSTATVTTESESTSADKHLPEAKTLESTSIPGTSEKIPEAAAISSTMETPEPTSSMIMKETETSNVSVTLSLKGAFNPPVDTHTSRSRAKTVGSGSISKNIKGGWRQVKSVGRAVTKSISPPRRKSDHDSLDSQENSSDSDIGSEDTEAKQPVLEFDSSLPQHQRHQRAGSWSFSSVQLSAASNVDIEEKEQAAASPPSPLHHRQKKELNLKPSLKKKVFSTQYEHDNLRVVNREERSPRMMDCLQNMEDQIPAVSTEEASSEQAVPLASQSQSPMTSLTQEPPLKQSLLRLFYFLLVYSASICILVLFMFSYGNSFIFTNVHSPTPTLDGKPTMSQFRHFTCERGSVDIVQEVADQCKKLGYLLQLPEAMVTNAMSVNSYGNVEDKCQTIILKWLQGHGETPVTWKTFIDVLNKIKYLLADELLEELSKSSRDEL